MRLQLQFDPVVFVRMASGGQGEVSVADGLVTLSGEYGRLVLREDTGELRKAILSGFGTANLTMQKGRLAALRREIEGAVGERMEDVSAVEALARILEEVVCIDALGLPGTLEQRKLAGRAAGRLLRAGGAWADQLIAALESRKEAKFQIPVTADLGGSGGWMRLVAMALVPVGDMLFPRESWPWLLLRETACVLCGKGQYAMKSLAAIYQSEQTGPVGCLATARLVALANPPLSRAFAEKGLERLSVADFRKDYTLFLEAGGEAAEGVRRLVETLRGLSPEEVDAVAIVLGPRAGHVARESIQALRGRHRDVSARDALSTTLEYWWEEYLREVVRAELSRRAALPRPPPAP